MDYLNIALPKGRIGEMAADLFLQSGYSVLSSMKDTRKLILEDTANAVKFFLVKPSDVPTYVEYGAADIGIVGKDILLEKDKNIFEVLDLGFGKCKMVLAAPHQVEDSTHVFNKRIATKFPNITREYFEHTKHESVEIIYLNGSIELAPLVGLSEYIVDIVETGSTLKENGLKILEEITEISARMVVNKVSFKMKNDNINHIINSFHKLIDKKE